MLMYQEEKILRVVEDLAIIPGLNLKEKGHLNPSDDPSDQSQRLEYSLWKFC